MNKTIKQTTKNQNIELLRTLSMLSIVIIHFYTHGLFKQPENYAIDFTHINGQNIIRLLNYLISDYIHEIVCVAVNIYVFITGYFLIDKHFKLKRILNVWFTTFFYSVLITLLFYFFHHSITIIEVIQSFFPITFNKYWFVTNYVGLLLLSPFINIVCKHITQKQFKILLFIVLLLNMSFLFVFPWGHVYKSSSSSLSWFICLYLTSAYIKLYGIKKRFRTLLKYTIFISILIFLYTIGLETISYFYHHGKLYHWGYAYNGLDYFLSVLIFSLFVKSQYYKHFLCDLLVKIAPYTFGVYLIHDNVLVRKTLWILFDWCNLFNSPLFLIYMFIIAIAVFSVCILLDYLRGWIFEKIKIFTLLEFFCQKINNLNFLR